MYGIVTPFKDPPPPPLGREEFKRLSIIDKRLAMAPWGVAEIARKARNPISCGHFGLQGLVRSQTNMAQVTNKATHEVLTLLLIEQGSVKKIKRWVDVSEEAAYLLRGACGNAAVVLSFDNLNIKKVRAVIRTSGK